MSSKKQGQNNPFLETTIKNWLSSTNELGYQMPFSQLLLSDGYSVCHNSKHNAFEQGKDVIAIDKYGTPCAFQLKGGNITNSKWRKEIMAEVEELISYKIVHPSVDKNKTHKSYLVTNGEIEDTVRLAIDNLNANKWKEAPLHVITGGELLNKFIDISSDFTPQEIEDYRSFLDLYFREPKELINEEIYTDFITDVLRLNDKNLKKVERRRNIASAVLYTGYIVSGTKTENNHVTVLQILTLLSSYIFGLAEKYSLDEKYWVPSVEIVWHEMQATSQSLQDEINNNGLDELVTSIWDGELGQYRRHLAVSYLMAYKCAQLINNDKKWSNILNDSSFSKMSGSLTIWGEGGVLPFILIFMLLQRASSSLTDGVYKPLQVVVETIVKLNGKDSKAGLFSPYYGITTAIKNRLGLLDEPIDETFTCRSFTLRAFIDLLARHNRRSDIEPYWRDITHLSQEDFTPKDTWMHFLWRSKHGESDSSFPNKKQSWSKLRDDAKQVDYRKIPNTLQKQPHFLPFFLLVYPHRITTNYIKWFDEIVAKETS